MQKHAKELETPEALVTCKTCSYVCTTVLHNTAQNSCDNLHSHPQTINAAQMMAVGVEVVTVLHYCAMHFSAFARSWDRMSSVCPSVCL